jgi:hypothetical protein
MSEADDLVVILLRALQVASAFTDIARVHDGEDHAITVTRLKNTYGDFFDVTHNPGHLPYGYDGDAVLASFRLLGSRFESLQTLCLAESGLDLSTVPLVS